jgi:hypothetical protein
MVRRIVSSELRGGSAYYRINPPLLARPNPGCRATTWTEILDFWGVRPSTILPGWRLLIAHQIQNGFGEFSSCVSSAMVGADYIKKDLTLARTVRILIQRYA